ncbi:putative ABC transport system ATP-binding protein [Metamycoplasma subdolum]|uniref:Putative ABC transport system ATP-binding protein n=1 Tax=Metamycoplasma subdolum TaxID=92407 RepID=A0A3M0A540_9BACT|nr:cysteine peptidase family C39 domain-containing protein [Metamycoplasma subdolum]RMA77585.1 putative ABC transport system ATP-binding protein [Metamycoplasma subdolum]WPB50379.1 cysteine peptidase family C39 domain-containing protein [Metamycoplasma subdolum]
MRIKIQNDIKDCGLVVLQAFYNKFYDKWININEFKWRANYSKQGINLEELAKIASNFNLELNAMQGDFVSFKKLKLKEEIFTLIFENNTFHYVIILEKNDKEIILLDPFKGKRKLALDDFKNLYQEVIIYVKKKEKILPIKLVEKRTIINNKIWLVILTIISTILSQVLIYGTSLFFKYIIDKYLQKVHHDEILKITIIFSWLIVVRIIIFYANSLLKQIMILKVQKQLFNSFYKATIEGNLKQLEKLTRSEYLQRVGLLPSVGTFLATIFSTIFNDILMLISISILLSIISWKLYLISIGFLSMLILIIALFKDKIWKKYNPILNNNLEIMTKQIESFLNSQERLNSSIKESNVKSFEFLMKSNEQISKTFFNTLNLKDGFVKLIILIGQTILVYIATFYLWKDELELGNLVLFNTLFSLMITPSESITNLLLNLSISLNDLTRVEYILNCEKEDLNTAGKIVDKITKISTKNLSFSYGSNLILNSINLSAKNSIVLKGNNGSGKTTLAKLFASYYLDYSGDIFINDINLKEINIKDWRNKVFINNNNEYFKTGFLIEVITNEDKQALHNFIENAKKFKLIEMLEKFNLNLNKRIEAGGMFLSSGQRQIINLLRLFAFDYSLIILDEAFENIEESSRKDLMKAISKIHKEKFFIEISHSEQHIFKKHQININLINC